MNNGMWKKKKEASKSEGSERAGLDDDRSPIMLCVYWEGDGEHLEGTAKVPCHFCGVDLALSPSGQRMQKNFTVRPTCSKCMLDAAGLEGADVPPELRQMIEKRYGEQG
jgi:hypothetical protein